MSRQVFVSKPDFLEVRCSEPDPFYFARRRGKNSIAVLLKHQDRYLIRYQPLVHIDDGDSKRLFACPITGSLDEGESPEQGAVREIKEEAGYNVNESSLKDLGSYIVGTQTDEVVYLFFADVSGLTPDAPMGDGTFHESISHNSWMSELDLRNLLRRECYSGLFIAYYRFKLK